MRPAGIFRDIAANGAGDLAAGVRRVKQAVFGCRFRELNVRKAGLHHGYSVDRVNLQDSAHATGSEHDATLRRHRSAA